MSNTITWQGIPATGLTSLTRLAVAPNSGAQSNGDKVTFTQRWAGKIADCRANLPARGQLGTGELAGWRILEATSEKQGPKGILTVVWEPATAAAGTGATLPPDTFVCTPKTFPQSITQHPRYAVLQSSAALWQGVLDWQATQSATDRSRLLTSLRTQAGANAYLVTELLGKFQAGKTEWNQKAMRYEWTFCAWSLPWLSGGGYLELPGGPMAGFLPSGWTWKREADGLSGNGTYYTITRAWEGAPAGILMADS